MGTKPQGREVRPIIDFTSTAFGKEEIEASTTK
jgi:hypothetical protein